MELTGQNKQSEDMIEFEYRSKFNLSYEDFMNEPFEIYQKNLDIMVAKSRYSDRLARSDERLSKLK